MTPEELVSIAELPPPELFALVHLLFIVILPVEEVYTVSPGSGYESPPATIGLTALI